MAKKRKKSRRSKGFTISVATIAGFMPLLDRVKDGWQSNGISGAGDRLSQAFTGYSYQLNTWHVSRLKHGWLYPLLGIGAHKIATRVGINRALRGIPFLRI